MRMETLPGAAGGVIEGAVGLRRIPMTLATADGSGEPAPKRYKLTLSVTDGATSPMVDAATGRAVSAILVVDADYALMNFDGTQTITRGVASASASYERTAQRFADVRAARDAEIRAAKLLADQIRTRLSAALVSRS